MCISKPQKMRTKLSFKRLNNRIIKIIMKVEIWSDVMCPFCYIGKRKFEMALAEFVNQQDVQIIWKSFQLNPDMITEPAKSVNQHLAEVKGWSIDYANRMSEHVTQIAKEVGLTYNMDKAIPANSFDAHRFSHLAKEHGLQNEVEEQLFAAYFTEGQNTADHKTLIKIGAALGLDEAEIKQMLESNVYADAVQKDIYEANELGIRGVPFFLFNNKYAISGAQQPQALLHALNKAWQEMEEDAHII